MSGPCFPSGGFVSQQGDLYPLSDPRCPVVIALTARIVTSIIKMPSTQVHVFTWWELTAPETTAPGSLSGGTSG